MTEAGAGPPILLLHGFACHGGFFRGQVEALAGEALVLAPDLPGHGRTGVKAGAVTIEAAADACAALIAGRGLRDVLVVGWSMGAAVAWSMIERHGMERLAGLVVVDMSPRVLNDAQWRLGTRDGLDAERNARVVQAMAANWPALAAPIAAGIFAEGGSPDPALVSWVEGEIGRADPAAMTAMWDSLTRQDFRTLLPRIGCPVVVAHGARSRLYAPEVARWQADRLPGARIVTFAASGHAPHLEEPDAFSALLRRARRGL